MLLSLFCVLARGPYWSIPVHGSHVQVWISCSWEVTLSTIRACGTTCPGMVQRENRIIIETKLKCVPSGVIHPYLRLGLYQASPPSAAICFRQLTIYGRWNMLFPKSGGWLGSQQPKLCEVSHQICKKRKNISKLIWRLAAEGGLA